MKKGFIFLVGIILIGLYFFLWEGKPQDQKKLLEITPPPPKFEMTQKDELPSDFFLKLLPLHEVKKPPRPFDWMAAHPEPGQTFEDYMKADPVRPSEDQKYIYVVLLGNFSDLQKDIGHSHKPHLRET